MREAEAYHLLHFGVHGVECLQGFAVTGVGLHERHIHGVDHITAVHSSGDERCVGFLGDVAEAFVGDGHHEAVEHVEHGDIRCLVVFGGYRFPLDIERHVGPGEFRVGDDAHDGFVVRGNHDCLLGFRVLYGGNVGHQGNDLLFHHVHVEIADDEERLHVGAVPAVVEITELLVVEAAEALFTADDVAGRVARIAVKIGPEFLIGPPACVLTGAELLDDDTALVVNLVAVERDVVRPVVENEQGGVDDAFAGDRHVGHVVAGHLLCGEGVQVGTEFHADALQVVNHVLAREVLGPVEGHVFEEVCESLLGVLLLQCPHIVENPEFCLIGGFVVVADVVSHPVVEHALAYLGVIGKLLCEQPRNSYECRGYR